ncbi:MAG: hypothetical protein H0W44_06750 [Gammaproteobacteria bacterium]|nr:hypothetical protein [Gammaproteobacteria bacterium]
MTIFSIAFCMLCLSACQDDGSDNPSTTPASTLPDQSRALAQTAMQAVYQNQRTPNNFYQETSPPAGVFITIQHVRMSDISSSTSTHRVCANDMPEAAIYANQAALTRNITAPVISAQEMPFYFEFLRAPNSSNWILQRVFKCGMYDESAGEYEQTPFDNAAYQQLIEYLWFFSPANNYGYAVIQTSNNSDAQFSTVSLLQVELQAAAGANGCDRIKITKRTYILNLATRQIGLEVTDVLSVDARFNGQSASLCNA